MKVLSKFEFQMLVVSQKLSCFTELQTEYALGLKVNEDAIYALNKANNLVAYYNPACDEYHYYDKPIRSFSKSKRKFVKYNLK